MSYFSQHKAYVDKQRDIYMQMAASPIRTTLLQVLDAYDREYSEYAKAADAWQPDRDKIKIFLTRFELLKQVDILQKTGEIYFVSVVADHGRKQEPRTYVMPNYQQVRKEEPYTFRDPIVLFEGNPKGSLEYCIFAYDTRTTNHNNNVAAATKITKDVGKLAATVLSAAVGPAAGVIAPLVDSIANTISKIATEHKDELVAQSLGFLTEHDHRDVGPYSLAKPELKLGNDKIKIDLLVVREPGQATNSRPTKKRKATAEATPSVARAQRASIGSAAG
jgi:hypothetical protein